MKSIKFLFAVHIAFVIMIVPVIKAYASEENITIRLHCWRGYARPYIEKFKQIIRNKYNIDVKVVVSNASNPSEFWDLSRGKKADLISPAHNILMSPTWNFVNGNIAIPIDTGNIPNFKYVLPFLQKSRFIAKDGKIYGVPYTMGAYGLAYNIEKVKEPESWNVLWKESSKKRYTVSKDYADCNIYIAALALGVGYEKLYDIDELMKAPRIGMNKLSLYNMKKSVLQEKLNVLAQNAYSLWEGTADPDEFDKLSYAVSWGYALKKANSSGLHWKTANPKEGSVMWVDHWVITYAVKPGSMKKKLCEEWINHCLSQDLQVSMIRNWGTSPVVSNIDKLITDNENQTLNVGKKEYWEALSFWENQNKRTTNAYKALWKHAVTSRKPDRF